MQTSATTVLEVKEIVLRSSPGRNINEGHFSLRFPEVQVVSWTSGSRVTGSLFFLALEKPDLPESILQNSGKFVTKTLKTPCIKFDASTKEIQMALEENPNENGLRSLSVHVTRSGDGSYSSDFG